MLWPLYGSTCINQHSQYMWPVKFTGHMPSVFMYEEDTSLSSVMLRRLCLYLLINDDGFRFSEVYKNLRRFWNKYSCKVDASTNRAQCRVTLFMRRMMLPLLQWCVVLVTFIVAFDVCISHCRGCYCLLWVDQFVRLCMCKCTLCVHVCNVI